MKTKKLVLNALFIAMHVVLCYVSINLGNMVITVSGLPIVIGAMLFGPSAGLEIGLIGSFLNQMLKYGLTPTTILWILPAGVKGLMIGAYAKHKNFKLNVKQMTFITILSAFVVTTMNTAIMYIDSKIYGYYSFAYVFGMIVWRYLSGIVTSIVYVAVIPMLMKHIAVFRDTPVEESRQIS